MPAMDHASHLVVSAGDLGDIARILGSLAQQTSAGSVLLLDTGGQLISAQGQGGPRDVVALGALLAGTFGSSRQVATLLGEADFRTIYQQGVHESISSSMVGDSWLLVIVFDRQTHVGLVQLLARRAVVELEAILSRVRGSPARERERVVNVAFRGSADAAIDELFRE